MNSATTHNSLFVKLISLREEKQILKLPEAWTLYWGHRLPLAVFLRNRYGDLWVVKVAYNCITNIYSFEDGWKSFVKFNKVVIKDRLVFKFNGISTFDFKLYGKNNEEKEYVRPAKIKIEEEELQPARQEGLGQKRQSDFDDEFTDEGPRPKKRKGKKRAPALNHADEDHIFRKAGIARPENPHFLTKRRTNRNNLYVPIEVIREFMLNFPEEVMIQDEKGKNWTSSVSKWKDGRLWLSKGWRSYCKWNKVGLDDWCVIEIMKPDTPGADIYLKARQLVPASSVQ